MTMTANPNLIYPKPAKADYGVGIVGAGGIVNGAHIPAYRNAGIRIAGICDIQQEAVENTAKRWGIEDVYTDYRKLIERADIDILDIAIPNEGRIEIVKEAVAAGKHVLIQKPFAYHYEQGEEMVRLAKEANVKLAVNQNARFAPFYHLTKQILDTGVLGELYFISHEMRLNQDTLSKDHWIAKIPKHFLLLDYEIHHIDLMRYWTGKMPSRVYASTSKMPGQNFLSDMNSLITMEFADGLRASLTTIDTNQSDHNFWRFTAEGTNGSLRGYTHDGYRFPTVEYYVKDQRQWIRPSIKGSWFSDAFYGVMFEFMSAIQEDREPSMSGEDNLLTLKLLGSIIESSETKEIVKI